MGLQRTSQEVIQSLIAAELYAKEHPTQEPATIPLVTVSRAFGCGGTDIARILAEHLKVRFYDQELLAEVVKAAKADRYMLERLDERVPGWMEELISSLFSKKAATSSEFHHYLLKVLLGISRTGGVIVGRGAHLMLRHHRPFRLRLEASPDSCVARVAARLAIKKGKAEKLHEQVTTERAEFLSKLSKKNPAKQTPFDMILNTDTFTPEQVVAIVQSAMKFLGYQVAE